MGSTSVGFARARQWIGAVLLCGLALPVVAQGGGEAQPPPPGFSALGSAIAEFPIARGESSVVTLDQERVYTGSLFGQRVAAELAATSRALASENRRIEAELTAEEKELTDRRASLTTEEFRPLAEAFDARVVGLRQSQDEKARALQRRDEAERQAFLRAALPILRDLIRDLGAVAILDSRAVLFADQRIDITDRAIARIDAGIGLGEALSPRGPILPDTLPAQQVEPPLATGGGVGLELSPPQPRPEGIGSSTGGAATTNGAQ